MIDEGGAIKTTLLAIPGITALTGTGGAARLWPDQVYPLAGYNPNQGIAIAWATRGGGSLYNRAMMSPRIQFKIWGADMLTARQGYAALVDALDGKSPGMIRIANLETLGQPGNEQSVNAGWDYILCFFTIWLVR